MMMLNRTFNLAPPPPPPPAQTEKHGANKSILCVLFPGSA